MIWRLLLWQVLLKSDWKWHSQKMFLQPTCTVINYIVHCVEFQKITISPMEYFFGLTPPPPSFHSSISASFTQLNLVISNSVISKSLRSLTQFIYPGICFCQSFFKPYLRSVSKPPLPQTHGTSPKWDNSPRFNYMESLDIIIDTCKLFVYSSSL